MGRGNRKRLRKRNGTRKKKKEKEMGSRESIEKQLRNSTGISIEIVVKQKRILLENSQNLNGTSFFLKSQVNNMLRRNFFNICNKSFKNDFINIPVSF